MQDSLLNSQIFPLSKNGGYFEFLHFGQKW